MKYFISNGYLSKFVTFSVNGLVDLRNNITSIDSNDRYRYNEITFANRNFTFDMGRLWNTYYSTEYIQLMDTDTVRNNGIVTRFAVANANCQVGHGSYDKYGHNVIGPMTTNKYYEVYGTTAFCVVGNAGNYSSSAIDTMIDTKIRSINQNATKIQKIESDGFVLKKNAITANVDYSPTSETFCNNKSACQSQFKAVNNTNTYILIYEGYNPYPFYINGKFNISYKVSSYKRTHIKNNYNSEVMPNDVIVPGGVSTANELYDFSEYYLYDLRTDIKAITTAGFVYNHSPYSFSPGLKAAPDKDLNPYFGNILYSITDLYENLEWWYYVTGDSAHPNVDNLTYRSLMSIDLTKTLSQKWPLQLERPILANCFYSLYTQDGGLYKHGLMPTITDGDFTFVCNPLFSTKIKLSNNRGLLHVGGFFPNNRYAVFTENNTLVESSVDTVTTYSYSTDHPADAPSADTAYFKPYFTGNILLASGGVYKGKRIPYKQESSKYIYVFDNSSMSFKIIGELPVPLFGASSHTLSDTEFLIIGGIATCPTTLDGWNSIVPEKSVYKITLNSDLTLKSVDKMPDLKFGHFYAAITDINDHLVVVSGSNYELYDVNAGSLKSGQIKSPRYGCYIQKYITGEGYDQYGLIGGWKNTVINNKTSICPIRFNGISAIEADQYNQSKSASNVTNMANYRYTFSDFEQECKTGFYMPDMEFFTDGSFIHNIEDPCLHLFCHNNNIDYLVTYENGANYSDTSPNIVWNDKIEVVSGLETAKTFPVFTVTKTRGKSNDQITFTLPPSTFYAPGDRATLTRIDSASESTIYADATSNATYSTQIIAHKIYIFRYYKADSSLIYEKQLDVAEWWENMNLTTSVEYPAIADQYVLTPTFTSNYDEDVKLYLVKDVHPEEKILLNKNQYGVGITYTTALDNSPYLGWYLRAVRPDGSINEIHNTYVSNRTIATTLTVLSPSNYSVTNGVATETVVGTEFTLQFDCPTGKGKDAYFVNKQDNTKVPIQIGIPFKVTISQVGTLYYDVEFTAVENGKTFTSPDVVFNMTDPTTTSFTVVSPAGYTGDIVSGSTEFTLQFDCSVGSVNDAKLINESTGNVVMSVPVNTSFKYTKPTFGDEKFHIESTTSYGNINISNSIELNTADVTSIALEVISPAGYAGEDVDNGTVFTLRLNCTNPAITTGRIGIQNPPQDEVYMDVNTNTPFTYTPPDYSSTTLTGEVINNGTTIYTNYINTYVTGPTIELGLTIISPSGYDNDDLNDVLNGTEFTIRCDATIPNGMSLSQPITLTGGTIENGWIQGIIGGDKTITTGMPFTLSIENNNTTQIWVSSTDNFGNQVTSNARNLKSVSTQETKILLTIAAPANCIYGGDIQNGTELMFKLLAREVNGVTITNPVLTGTKYESGQQVNITPIPITVETLLAYIPTADTQSQLWVSAQLSTGGNIVSNTMYVNMREQNSDHS